MSNWTIGKSLKSSGALVMTIISAVISPGLATANDITIDVNEQQPRFITENGGFLELGIGVGGGRRLLHQPNESASDDYELFIELLISAGYRYNRFFVEATESSFDGLNLGFTVLNTKHWTVDALFANIAGNVTVESDEPPPPITEDERNDAIMARDNLFIAAGARVTGYFGDNIAQFRLVSDWYDGNGISGSARLGRQWQLENWNLQAIGGVRYYSEEFSQYLFGVSEEEQSSRFPEYDAGDAWIPEAEIGLRVPVAENWVYTSRLRYRQYPNSITNSPLVANDSDVIFHTGLFYVF